MYRGGLNLGDSRPISYLGTNPRTMPLFLVGLISAAALLSAFAREIRRLLTEPNGFLPVFLLGMACQAIVGVVPISGDGISHAIHSTAGIVLGLSLPLLMWRFAAAQRPGRWRQLSYGLMWLEATGCVAGVALSRASLATVAEAVPACLFHLWVVVVTVRWQSVS